jgi:lambda family phage tail tape measure protein
MADQQIRIVLTADSSAAQAGLKQVDQALNKTASGAKVSAAQTAAAMRTLPAQFTDIATQLQGGASPLTVLLQQGGQIKDSFGSFGGAIRGIGQAIGPLLTNPLTLAAAAAIAVGAAFVQGEAESNRLQRSLILTGNAVGVTAGQLGEMAQRLDEVGGSRGQAAAALDVLVTQGGVAAGALEKVAGAAIALERAGGPAVEETAKAFASLARDPVNAALELNKSTNFLTASVFKQIKALQDQGKTADAARLAQEAYADSINERAPKLEQNLGTLQRAWRSVKEVASEAWDAMLNIGRKETPEQQIESINKQLDDIAKRRANIKFGGLMGKSIRDDLAADEAALRAKLRSFTQAQEFEKQAAEAGKAQLDQVNAEVRDSSEGHQRALLDIAKAGAAQRLAQTSLNLGTARAIYDQAYAREQISATEHAEALRAIDLARLDAEEQNLNRLKALEARRTTTGPDDRLAQQASLQDFETQRLGIQERRIALQLKEIDNGKAIANGVNLFAIPDNSDAILARVRASLDAQKQLAEQTEQIDASRITSAEARGRALIAIEERQIRERLDLASLGDDARRQAEDELAAYIGARTAELVDSLKPEWQRMVEDYQDTAGLIRQANDTIMTGLLRDSEDAWVQWVTTGKFSARQLVSSVLSEMARLQFRQLIGGATSGSGSAGMVTSLLGAAVNYFSGVQTSYSGVESAADFMGPVQRRATGGPVDAGGLYQINELGTPEVLSVGGRSFLMMGSQAGTVSPSGPTGGVSITINQTVGDVVTSAQLAAVAERTRQAAIAGVADAQRRGRG